MLTKEENDLLHQVGAGTPMGDLLRRYWHPVAAVGELEEHPVKPCASWVRIWCCTAIRAERTASSNATAPIAGPIFPMAGWRDRGFGVTITAGNSMKPASALRSRSRRCPRPEARFKDKVRAKAYQVQAKAGLLWAYLGDAPAPELWDWDRYYDRGYKQVVFSDVPCNWLQCQENSIDPVHFEWLHSNWGLRLVGEDGEPPTHLKIGFEEFEFGFRYLRVLADSDEQSELWTVGRVCLWPNALYTGHFEWRVPVDDEHTLSVGWFIDPVPDSAPFEQETIPYWRSPITDAETGRWLTTHLMNQDFVAWVGQGAVSDRWNEHLGESDRGVISVRKRFMDDLKIVADGGDPKGLIRDESRNHQVPLPRVGRGGGFAPGPQSAYPHPFPYLSGQPGYIKDEIQSLWTEYSSPQSKE